MWLAENDHMIRIAVELFLAVRKKPSRSKQNNARAKAVEKAFSGWVATEMRARRIYTDQIYLKHSR